MTEHYTTNTESATRWCNHCGRFTQYSVTAGRLGRCTEHDAPAYTKKQLKHLEKLKVDKRQPCLF